MATTKAARAAVKNDLNTLKDDLKVLGSEEKAALREKASAADARLRAKAAEAEAKLRIAIAEGRQQVVIDGLQAEVTKLRAAARSALEKGMPMNFDAISSTRPRCGHAAWPPAAAT